MKLNSEKEQLKQSFNSLKKELSNQREKIGKIEGLVKKQVDQDYEINLWELSDKELDQEMGNRLTLLNEDIDCMQLEKITSHRKIVGPLIVGFKKMASRILLPFITPFFERQKQFNKGVVNYLLASFIRFRSMEQRLKKLERDIAETDETQDAGRNGIGPSLERQRKNDTERKR
jgi:hypothetical protein